MAGRSRSILCFLALGFAFQPTARAQSPSIPPAEQAAIEANRRNAKPRPIVLRRALEEMEAARVRVFKSARSSVVHIATIAWAHLPVAQNTFTRDLFHIPAGSGTGIVWDEYGHVVTNLHVITVNDQDGIPLGEVQELQVTLADGKTYKAQVIGRSVMHDLAVLHVFGPLKSMKPLPLGRSSELQVGQSVLAIGDPFGLDHTLTAGIVSALGREFTTGYNSTIRGAIQTDAAINPGNSGGPLLDSAGRLIGMNSAITLATGASVGIGFAIPVDTLNRVVPQLIAKGRMESPDLGFTALHPDFGSRLGVKQGIAVFEVEPGGLADRAGMRGLRLRARADGKPPTLEDVEALGDIIVSFQGKPVSSDVELKDLVEMEKSGRPWVFTLLRNGKSVNITLDPSGNKGPKPAESGPTV